MEWFCFSSDMCVFDLTPISAVVVENSELRWLLGLGFFSFLYVFFVVCYCMGMVMCLIFLCVFSFFFWNLWSLLYVLIGFFVLNLRYHIRKGFGMFEVVPSVFPPFFLFLKSPTMVCFFLFSPFFFDYVLGSCMCLF